MREKHIPREFISKFWNEGMFTHGQTMAQTVWIRKLLDYKCWNEKTAGLIKTSRNHKTSRLSETSIGLPGTVCQFAEYSVPLRCFFVVLSFISSILYLFCFILISKGVVKKKSSWSPIFFVRMSNKDIQVAFKKHLNPMSKLSLWGQHNLHFADIFGSILQPWKDHQ